MSGTGSVGSIIRKLLNVFFTAVSVLAVMILIIAIASLFVGCATAAEIDAKPKQQILICSCKKPAFIINEHGVIVYEMELNDPHLNELVVQACKGEVGLPGVDTYDTGQAKNHACPVEI